MTVEPTWQTYSLFEYVTDNTPDGWEEFFEMEACNCLYFYVLITTVINK